MSRPGTHDVPGRKLAGYAAIASLPFAYLTQALFAMSVNGDTARFHDGQYMMGISVDQAKMFYAGMWTDVLGYYLIFVPFILYFWKNVRHVNESAADLGAISGIIYCLLGSFGAVDMAGAFAALHASDLPTEARAAVWDANIGGNWRGYWLLEAPLAAIWLGSAATLLKASGLKALGMTAGVLAALWLGNFLTAHIGLQSTSDALLGVVALAAPLWAAWAGVTLLRGQGATSPAPA